MQKTNVVITSHLGESGGMLPRVIFIYGPPEIARKSFKTDHFEKFINLY